MAEDKGITTKKDQNISDWYEQVCLKAELADFGAVKGTMVIRPRGYAIWEAIQAYFDREIVDKNNVRNAQFPLFIPEHFFTKEAEHAEGFEAEVAWIDKGETKEEGRVALRPSSESIIYDSFGKWIRSHRDLPLKVNQWCNVVRWEVKQTKLFLRSREFLWQEGHCAYATEKECEEEVALYIKAYQQLCKDILALPMIVGRKTPAELFPGAVESYTIEGLMPDGKALQCGTSHKLSQGFAKSFGISFLGEDGKEHLPWQNSWGISTRLIGGVVMTHSDDKGLVLPPAVCKEKVVIIPILAGNEKAVLGAAKKLEKTLTDFGAFVDERDHRPGWKFSEWEMKGIPLRVEIGPKDLEKKQAVLVRRDTGEKKAVALDKIEQEVEKQLKAMHSSLYKKAAAFLQTHIVPVSSLDALKKVVKEGKLGLGYFSMKKEHELLLGEKLPGVTARCVPLDQKKGKGKCIISGEAATEQVYFGRSY